MKINRLKFACMALATVVGTNAILFTPTFAADTDTKTFNFGELKYGTSSDKKISGPYSEDGKITSGNDYFNINCKKQPGPSGNHCNVSIKSNLDAKETPYTGTAVINKKTYAISVKIVPAEIKVEISGSTNNIKVFNGEEQSYTGFSVNAPKGYAKESVVTKDEAKNTVSGTDVGVYTTKLDASNFENTDSNYDVTFSIDKKAPVNALTIIKATVAPSLTIEDVQYGDEITPEITGNLYGGEATVYYRTAGFKHIHDYTTNVPTEPGKYEAFVKVAETKNSFSGISLPTTFEITKRTVTVNVIGNSKEVTYNGLEHKLQGFEFNFEDSVYDLSKISVNGLALAPITATEVGVYENTLDEAWFTNKDSKHFDVTFNIVSGSLTIKEAPATPVTPVASITKKTPLTPNTGLAVQSTEATTTSNNNIAILVAITAILSAAGIVVARKVQQ